MISPPIYSIFLISAAALAYEVLLIRLFSIIQWHHFAYMIISLALLGYGVSGTFLALTRDWLVPRFTGAFIANSLLFSISAIGCFLLAQALPFNTLEMFWDPVQWRYLLLSYLLLFIPFFFAANCICLSFACFGEQIPRIYSFDLIGAGVGALGVIVAMYLLPAQGVLQLIVLIGLLATAIAGLETHTDRRWLNVVFMLLLALTTVLVPGHWLTLQLSEYKPLSQALRISGAKVIAEEFSPLGTITVLENTKIPLRLASGLSLNNSVEPPPQLGIYTDGDTPSPITHYSGDLQSLAYLDYQTSALPYHVRSPEKVLILGLGGGSGLLQAKYARVNEIEVVELNPQVTRLLREDYADYAGWPLLEKHVRIHRGEARGFLSANQDAWDLIQISLMDSAGAASAGLYALSENYTYTVEGLTEYLQHLRPGGMLAITRWVKIPPRDGLKMFATAIAALRQFPDTDPGQQLLMIRGWNTSTLLVKNEPFTDTEIQHLKSFSDERSFDSVYYPGIMPQQANVYNILEQPYYFQGVSALLGDDSESFIGQYKFDLSPATDDRPYFFNFFKWSSLTEILSLQKQGGLSLLELGYPVLVLTLMQALVVSLIMVLLPLRFIRDRRGESNHRYSWRVGGYFLSIGLAFLFVEIAFIQKFILFLAHPLYAVAVVLFGFLIFSGIGSHYAGILVKRHNGNLVAFLSVIILSAIAILYIWLLPPLFSWLAVLPDMGKVLVTLLLIAPLALCMGTPLPLGLHQVSLHAPRLVPWAWGVNGFASLISAVLATLLAIHFGFTTVILLAVLLYFLAISIGTD